MQVHVTFPAPVVTPPYPLWQVKHDIQMWQDKVTYTGWGDYGGHDRPYWRDGHPEVFWVLKSHEVPFTEPWQLLSYQLNLGMSSMKWRETDNST